MCHPWLAAGVTGFIGVLLAREIVPVLRRAEPGASLDHGLLGDGVRSWFRARVEPLVDSLLAAGIRADAVTAMQLAMSGISGAAYAGGWLFTAGWLLLAAGTLDVLDGSMARKGGAASPRGAFVDSVVDRYGEFAVFVGLAIHFRGGWPLWAVVAALFGAFMVSYTRARGEGLGVQCAIGFLQRAERYVLIGGGSLIGTLAAHLACAPLVAYEMLVTALVLVAILANATALQRAIAIVRRLA
jgi:CDP-diacylglycerol---glycerol-3-phosphate 3-phosphatidyltransferase